MNFPVIGAINTLRDAKAALDNIRNYFTSSEVSGKVGKVTVTQPATAATLTIDDGKTLRAAENWQLGTFKTGETGLTMSTTKHVNVVIQGVHVKLAVID